MSSNLISRQADLITKIQNGIKVTNADDVYSCGMRNGMRWCMSLIDGKEPLYENCPSAQPEIIRCKDCKHWDRTWSNDWSPDYHYCPVIDEVRKDDFHCRYAERRTDERKAYIRTAAEKETTDS